jgi:hypothetical protein
MQIVTQPDSKRWAILSPSILFGKAVKSIQRNGETSVKRCYIFAIAALNLLLAVKPVLAQVNQITFDLVPQPKFVNCLGVEGGPTPTATVTVNRGGLHDTLILHASNLKPHLKFDLFTIQNSNLLSNGKPDVNFKNFGLAWYQTDVQANPKGEAQVAIATILLDQIFGFDPASNLLPTHTFHVGFWFNNPEDAAACGFDVNTPTPFNGEQDAGPNAMISLPNATTKLGPLCTNPNTHTKPATCNE